MILIVDRMFIVVDWNRMLVAEIRHDPNAWPHRWVQIYVLMDVCNYLDNYTTWLRCWLVFVVVNDDISWPMTYL